MKELAEATTKSRGGTKGQTPEKEPALFGFRKPSPATPKYKSTYNKSFMVQEMRLYVAYCITHPKNPSDFREIKCERCGSYENLEFHHLAYDEIFIKDIRILCCKCHRNAKVSGKKASKLRTVFEDGKRFCEVSIYKFEY